jgi:hypothetical protein
MFPSKKEAKEKYRMIQQYLLHGSIIEEGSYWG